MVWGQSSAKGIDDLVARIKQNDPKLESLHILRFRRLNLPDVESLSQALKANTNVTELSCSNHDLCQQAAQLLGDMLAENAGLRSISIGNSKFGDQGVAALVPGLAVNRTLESLDCDRKGLTCSGASSLAACLEVHPALQRLSLCDNPLGDLGVAALCVPWRQLRRLELRSCSLGAGAVAALAAAPGLPSLTSLDLSHNPGLSGPEAGRQLALLLGAARSLASLDLGHTGLGDEAVALVGGALAGGARRLSQLQLASSGCGAGGCAALARALRAGAALSNLGLGFNPGLTDEALSELAAAAAAPAGGGSTGIRGKEAGEPCADACGRGGGGGTADRTRGDGGGDGVSGGGGKGLVALDLSGTLAGEATLSALARAPRLQQLSLVGCQLGDGGGAALVRALRGDTGGSASEGGISKGGGGGSTVGFQQLRDLNLAGCQLALQQVQQLLAVVSGGGAAPALVALEVSGNPGVAEDGFEQLLSSCQEARPSLVVQWRMAQAM